MNKVDSRAKLFEGCRKSVLITGLKGLIWDYSGAKLRKLLPKKPRAAIVSLGLTDAEAIQAGRDVAEALRESSSSSGKSSSSNSDEAASDPDSSSVADGSMREGGSSDGKNKPAKHGAGAAEDENEAKKLKMAEASEPPEEVRKLGQRAPRSSTHLHLQL